jgi:hypothetical protein
VWTHVFDLARTVSLWLHCARAHTVELRDAGNCRRSQGTGVALGNTGRVLVLERIQDVATHPGCAVAPAHPIDAGVWPAGVHAYRADCAPLRALSVGVSLRGSLQRGAGSLSDTPSGYGRALSHAQSCAHMRWSVPSRPGSHHNVARSKAIQARQHKTTISHRQTPR